MSLSLFFSVLLTSLSIQAAFIPGQSTPPTQLSTPEIDRYTPYTHFASAAYCKPNATLSWTCEAGCQETPDFIPFASGGNGASVQFWYVGFSPLLNSVIVGHQGTDPSEIESIATDVNLFLERLDPYLFPGMDSSVMVHRGFANAQADTATEILEAVGNALASYGAPRVTVVGHSLGAAIALIDTVYLRLWLPDDVAINMIGYGMPRVGNQAFADYVDGAHLDVKHINNKKDIVPVVPDRALGYSHPSGEIHIDERNRWESCPGQDNLNRLCSAGDVPFLFLGNVKDHSGPYNGIMIGKGC